MKKSDCVFYAHSKEGEPQEKWQQLEEHLLNVAKLSGQFAEKIGLGKAGFLLGLMHDIGKYSSAFQDYLITDDGKENPDQDDDNE